jgi:hypothetical protein
VCYITVISEPTGRNKRCQIKNRAYTYKILTGKREENRAQRKIRHRLNQEYYSKIDLTKEVEVVEWIKRD